MGQGYSSNGGLNSGNIEENQNYYKELYERLLEDRKRLVQQQNENRQRINVDSQDKYYQSLLAQYKDLQSRYDQILNENRLLKQQSQSGRDNQSNTIIFDLQNKLNRLESENIKLQQLNNINKQKEVNNTRTAPVNDIRIQRVSNKSGEQRIIPSPLRDWRKDSTNVSRSPNHIKRSRIDLNNDEQVKQFRNNINEIINEKQQQIKLIKEKSPEVVQLRRDNSVRDLRSQSISTSPIKTIVHPNNTHETEFLKIENNSLKRQLKDIQEINQRNVNEVVKVTNKLNEIRRNSVSRN